MTSKKIKIRKSFKGVKESSEVKKLLLVIPRIIEEVNPLIPDSVHELSLTFCSDEYIKKINANFRGKNKPTDVLSFPLIVEGDLFCPSLGDLIISLPTAKRQAKEYQVTYLYELKKLFIHGILHLLGFDHEKVSQKERMKMKRMEKKLIEKY